MKKTLALLTILAALALTANACTPTADVTVSDSTATPQVQTTEAVDAT